MRNKIETGLMIAFLLTTLLYLSFHVGRYYEKGQAMKQVSSRQFDCDFIIPDDMEYAGEVGGGVCMLADDNYNLYRDYFGTVK